MFHFLYEKYNQLSSFLCALLSGIDYYLILWISVERCCLLHIKKTLRDRDRERRGMENL